MDDHLIGNENEDALHRMAMSGDNLNMPRDIDFSVIFDSQASAREFCRLVFQDGIRTDCHRSDNDSPVWDVTVTSNMVPTSEAISLMEDRLARLAAPLGGQNDGWGCFAVPK